MILAVAIALVATCNGLLSLLPIMPSVAVPTRIWLFLTPWLGFASWMFLVAKTASAATAALGFIGYLLNAMDMSTRDLTVPTALAAVVIFTLIVLGGIQRSANIAIVSITLLSLGFFVIAGLPVVASTGLSNFTPFFQTPNPESVGPYTSCTHASA